MDIDLPMAYIFIDFELCLNRPILTFALLGSVSDQDPSDPYHLAGSGSTSGNVDPDPNSKEKL